MRHVLETFFSFGPLVFAVGFLWPLFAELLGRAGVEPRWVIGGAVALTLGAVAQVRGSWV